MISRNYAFEHKGKAYTPNKTEIGDSVAHNAALEQAELAEWAARPDRFAVYVGKDDRVTTWLGTTLGTIYYRRSFSTNLSRNITTIRFRGTNGASYYGRFGADWSQLCRVRKFKEGEK